VEHKNLNAMFISKLSCQFETKNRKKLESFLLSLEIDPDQLSWKIKKVTSDYSVIHFFSPSLNGALYTSVIRKIFAPDNFEITVLI
jgi:hypothetical protein